MSALIALLTVLLLLAVISVVSAPLRRGPGSGEEADPERDDLEAARAAKYREIRDAELDYRTGKLSQEDYDAVDGSLRTEAVEILDRLQASQAADGDASREPDPPTKSQAEPKGDS
jgi:hypothetical protein